MSEIQVDPQQQPLDYSVPLEYNGDFGGYNYGGIQPRRQARGKDIKSYNPLHQIVGSRLHQDIVRRNNFMPGQFNEWNEKPTGGGGKYWGGDNDVDGDGIPEFVVRKGGEHGPIVAVNGYTTKQSDWIARRRFYEQNPNSAARKGKTVRSFMKDYFKPTYDNKGDITTWTIAPTGDVDYNKYHKMYNFHAPKSMSPYRAIGAHIVFPAIKTAFYTIAGNNHVLAKYVRKIVVHHYGTKAYEAMVLSGIYNQLVKDPLLNSIEGSLEQIKQDYITLKKSTKGSNFNPQFDNPNSADYKEFERWLFNKKDIKDKVKNYVDTMLTTQAKELQTALTQSLVQKLTTEIQGLQESAKSLLQEDLVQMQAKFE